MAPPVARTLVAVFGAEGSAVVTVSFDRSSGRLIVAPHRLEVGAHSAQRWVVPKEGLPRSLGVIAVATPAVTRVPAAAALPTGPVILTGKIVGI